jgi:hypothetical protein
MRASISLNTVLALSAAALLVFLWSVLLDWRFVLGEWNLTVNQLGVAALLYAAYIGGWIWALLAAAQGRRRALIAMLIYAVLLCAYAVLDLLVYCPTTCGRIWLYYIANWSNLILGILAVATSTLRFRQAPTP